MSWSSMKCVPLVGLDGFACNDQVSIVKKIESSDGIERLYHIRVEVDSTYLIGSDARGFALWVHNDYSIRKAAVGTYEILNDKEKLVKKSLIKIGADDQRNTTFQRLEKKANLVLKSLLPQVTRHASFGLNPRFLMGTRSYIVMT